MRRASTFAFWLIALAFAAIPAAPPSMGQSGPGWTTLIDGKSMGD